MKKPIYLETNKTITERIWQQKALILMTVPGLLILLIFNYFPMYGVMIAFVDYSPRAGVINSPWVGLKYFIDFFNNPLSFRILRNTFLLGVYGLFWGFPAPIILALLFNELKGKRFKKLTQTISYFPHFISVVIVAGIVKDFASRGGLLNQIRELVDLPAISFLLHPRYFRALFISSSVWQGIGFGSIIYLAALSTVDKELLDAAVIDGANRFQRIRHINWPAILPTTTILLIFSISAILGTDFQKVMLLYSPATYSTADVVGTYVYREGIQGQRFEHATAIGLMMSIMGFFLIVSANWFTRKFGDTSLW